MNLRLPRAMPNAEAAGSARPKERSSIVHCEEYTEVTVTNERIQGTAVPRTRVERTVMAGQKKTEEKRIPER